VYLPDVRARSSAVVRTPGKTAEQLPRNDAPLQQSKGCLYALGTGAHNPRAASADSLRDANRDQKGVTFRPDMDVTSVTGRGELSLISTAFHILLY
jgi:hypothetical protein